MSFVAAAIGGGSLASGLLGYFGAQSAAKTQAGYETQALGLEQNALEQQIAARQQLQPWITGGASAIKAAGSLYGPNPDFSAFTKSPDYAFALQQGNLGLQRYENANGLALSGGALKDVTQFNQGLATQQFGNYFSRLMQIATLGQNAAAANVSGANAGVTGAMGAGGTLGTIGASLGGGTVGGVNAVTGGINSGIQNTLLYNLINKNNPATMGTPNPSSYAPPQPAAGWPSPSAGNIWPGS